MKKLNLYRIQNSNGTNPQLINSEYPLSTLYTQIQSQKGNKNFQIYYHYRPYTRQSHGNLKLKEIVALQPMQQPTFLIYDLINDLPCPAVQKYGLAVAEIMGNREEEVQENKNYSVGENGIVIFDQRRISVLASSVNQVTKKEEYDITRKQIIKGFNQSITQSNKPPPTLEQTLIRKVLQKIGIIKQQLTPKTLLSTIEKLKQLKTPSDVKEHIQREYSDYDPKFATYLEAIYLKYGILNLYHLHYVEYKNMSDGVIKYKFPNDAKIVIIGDYGTGLSDSIGLLRHAILEREADIILHLGDVYYAGTPQEYKNHVMEPLNVLRKEAGRKFKKNVLFYSIPGNHDYYTWGLPFLTFIANANQVKQITKQFLSKPKSTSSSLPQQQDPELYKQNSSYFCLQSQDSRWQFIGLDTAYHDSNPTNQLNGMSLGPRLRQKQTQWFIDKMQHFPGSTILLTHHQLFSIHDRICGLFSQYKVFSCINPLLSAQLFKYLKSISMWFWGHQHSLMFFDEDVFGVRKCRLLGNSSFHVFQKQGPYLRKKGFPQIPLIQQDQKYIHKYLPLNPQPPQKNPNQINPDCYYNLTYALIDFQKQKMPAQSPDPFSSTLQVQYWCCPCYPEQQSKKQHFTPYLLYEQEIQPRMSPNYVTSQKQLKNVHDFVGNIQEVREGDQVWVKSQIGIFVDAGVRLGVGGLPWRVKVQKSCNQEIANSPEFKNKKAMEQQTMKKQENQEKVSYKIQENQKKIPNEENEGKKQQQIITIQGKLILDGDIISFDQIKHIHKSCSMQQKIQKLQAPELKTELIQAKVESEPLIKTEAEPQMLQKQPNLQPLMSLQSSGQIIPDPKQQSPSPSLPPEIHPTMLPSLLPITKFEIRKHRILKDISLHMKYGDAFSLKDIASNHYLGVHVGIYGGVLKLMEVKNGEQPCLFMFLKGSKVKSQFA